MNKRTLRIRPFQDDKFALIIGQRMRFAIGALQREIGRGPANRGHGGRGILSG